MMPELDHLPYFIDGIMSSDAATQKECATDIRGLLKFAGKIKEIVDAGCIVGRMVEFAQYEHHFDLQLEAYDSLIQLTSKEVCGVQAVVDAGAVPVLVRNTMQSKHELIRALSITILDQIAKAGPTFYDAVVSGGFIEQLLRFIDAPPGEPANDIGNAVRALSYLFEKGRGLEERMIKLILHTLMKFVSLTSPLGGYNESIMSSFATVSANSAAMSQELIDVGLVPRLSEIMKVKFTMTPESFLYQMFGTRTIANLTAWSDDMKQIVIDQGFVPILHKVMGIPISEVQRDALRAIANIAAGTQQQIQSAIDQNGLVGDAVKLMCQQDTAQAAAAMFLNVPIRGSFEQLMYFVGQGCIPHLCNHLKSSNTEFVADILDGFNRMIELEKKHQQSQMESSNESKQKDTKGGKIWDAIVACGGTDVITGLRTHSDSGIRTASNTLCENA